MFYRVLAYSPEPTSEAASPCLVLALGDNLSSSDKPSLFLSVSWSRLIAPRHQKYILALAKDWGRATSPELVTSLQLLDELTVGALRVSTSGSCTGADLPILLESIFGRSGYFLAGPDQLRQLRRSDDAAENIPT
jgi:hypothetical protein